MADGGRQGPQKPNHQGKIIAITSTFHEYYESTAKTLSYTKISAILNKNLNVFAMYSSMILRENISNTVKEAEKYLFINEPTSLFPFHSQHPHTCTFSSLSLVFQVYTILILVTVLDHPLVKKSRFGRGVIAIVT